MHAHKLDDMEGIRTVDAANIIDMTLKLPEQFGVGWDAACAIEVKKPADFEIKNIIVAGMGGSGVGGDILGSWLGDRIDVPIASVKDYSLPRFASKGTLLFTVSYSGNTEETLSAFEDGVKKGCRIVAITSGGELERKASMKGIPTINIPKGYPPRTTIGFMTSAMACVLQKMGILHSKGEDELHSARELLEKLGKKLGPNTPLKDNEAKRIAVLIKGTTPVIYASRDHAAAANRWHAQLNENSKMLSWFGTFPELNHNEVVGWGGDDGVDKYSIVMLADSDDNERVKKRMALTRKIFFDGKVKDVIDVKACGESTLEHAFSLIYVGDFASIYLAILRGIDPTPVAPIEEFKKKLDG